MAKYIETFDSVEASLAKHFKTTRETNIRVDPHTHYKFGYGADLETVYLTDKVKLVGIMFCHPDSELARGQIHSSTGIPALPIGRRYRPVLGRVLGR